MVARSRFIPRRPMNRPRPADAPVFREIVARVSAAEAARRWGVSINSRGLACCPLHAEDTPSCKFYPGTGGFYCFGCGTGGDVITLAERMFGLSPLDAAKKLDADFSLGLFEGGASPSADRICAARTPEQRAEQRAEQELERLRQITPDADPAAYGAAQGRIEYLEYYLEEVRAQKCMEKIAPTDTTTRQGPEAGPPVEPAEHRTPKTTT